VGVELRRVCRKKGLLPLLPLHCHSADPCFLARIFSHIVLVLELELVLEKPDLVYRVEMLIDKKRVILTRFSCAVRSNHLRGECAVSRLVQAKRKALSYHPGVLKLQSITNFPSAVY
jgi:hypothetical protein